jgi:hypothetical protein
MTPDTPSQTKAEIKVIIINGTSISEYDYDEGGIDVSDKAITILSEIEKENYNGRRKQNHRFC